MSTGSPGKSVRRIWLCADDYGMSPGVSAAIRDLIDQRRLNATSVMVVAPSFDRAEAEALDMAAKSQRAAIGLHVTLTAPFRPLSSGFAPLRADAFLPLPETLVRALARTLDRKAVATEVAAQIAAFVDAFGRPPDFVDGHQHVHVFPQIREAVLATVDANAPHAWVRQCGRAGPLARRFGDPKGLLLDVLSGAFRRRAARLGIRSNPAFAGTYDFGLERAFAERFPSFLNGLPDGGVLMCHPGRVDAELLRLDPVTTAREQEYAFFAGNDFPRMLAERGIDLA